MKTFRLDETERLIVWILGAMLLVVAAGAALIVYAD